MSPRWFTWFVTLAMVTGAPRISAARPQAAPSATPAPEAVQRAEGLYREGVRLFREKKWAEAEREFRAAWALNPTFDVAYNLGNVEFRLGKYRDAAEHLAFALRVWPLLEATSSLRPVAEKRLAEARAFVGALTVKVNVAQAEVLVDGVVVGTAPLSGEVFVEPGTHVVEAKAAGYGDAKQTVTIEKGAAMAIELSLKVVTHSTVADSKVIAVGNQNREQEPKGREDGLRKKLVIAGIASSAVLVTGGVVFAIIANAKAATEDDQRAALTLQGQGTNPCLTAPLPVGCKELESSIAANGTFSNLSFWSFVAGGAVGVGTAVYALAAPKPPKSTLRAAPVVSRDAAGVVIVGCW